MRPLLLYIRAINVNPNPSDPEPSATGASASFPRPRATLSVCTCSDPVLPLIYRFPCRPSVPSVLSVPLPSSPSPFLQPTLSPFLFLCLSHQCFLPQSPLMFKDQMQQDVIMVLKFPSNSPVTHVAANTLPHLSIPAAVTVTCSRLFAVNRWHNTVGECTLMEVRVKFKLLKNFCD